MSYDTNNQVDKPLCSCCSGGSQEDVFLCDECFHPERFRIYCSKCKRRIDLGFEDAIGILSSIPGSDFLVPKKPGTVYRFVNGCPSCQPLLEDLRIIGYSATEVCFQ